MAKEWKVCDKCSKCENKCKYSFTINILEFKCKKFKKKTKRKYKIIIDNYNNVLYNIINQDT